MAQNFLLIALAVFAVFLVLLSVLAMAVTKTVGSEGKQRGFLGGCALVAALLFITGLGILGLVTFILVSVAGTVVEKNPIESISITRPGEVLEEEHLHPVPAERAHLHFMVRGDLGDRLMEMVRGVVDYDPEGDDEFLKVERIHVSEGIEYAHYDFALPITDEDLVELENEIERELDGMRVTLPEEVTITFEGYDSER